MTSKKTSTCHNCKKEIRLLSEAGPWIHSENFSVNCHEATEATPMFAMSPNGTVFNVMGVDENGSFVTSKIEPEEGKG